MKVASSLICECVGGIWNSFSWKGPCDALGAAGKGGVNKGLATGGLDCGGDGDDEVAKCVVKYLKDNHSKPDGWATIRNIRNIPMTEIEARSKTESLEFED